MDIAQFSRRRDVKSDISMVTWDIITKQAKVIEVAIHLAAKVLFPVLANAVTHRN